MTTRELEELARQIEDARGIVAVSIRAAHPSLASVLEIAERKLDQVLEDLEAEAPELHRARELRRRRKQIKEGAENGLSRAELVALGRSFGWSGSTADRRAMDALKGLRDVSPAVPT